MAARAPPSPLEHSCSLSGFSGAGSSPRNTPVTGATCKTRLQPPAAINRKLPAQEKREVSRPASLGLLSSWLLFRPQRLWLPACVACEDRDWLIDQCNLTRFSLLWLLTQSDPRLYFHHIPESQIFLVQISNSKKVLAKKALDED